MAMKGRVFHRKITVNHFYCSNTRNHSSKLAQSHILITDLLTYTEIYFEHEQSPVPLQTSGRIHSHLLKSLLMSKYTLHTNFLFKWDSLKQLPQFIKIHSLSALNAHESIVCAVALVLLCHIFGQPHWLLQLKWHTHFPVVTCTVLCLAQLFGTVYLCMYFYGILH